MVTATESVKVSTGARELQQPLPETHQVSAQEQRTSQVTEEKKSLMYVSL